MLDLFSMNILGFRCFVIFFYFFCFWFLLQSLRLFINIFCLRILFPSHKIPVFQRMCIINFVDLLYVSVVRVFCGFLAKVENFHARLRGNNTDRDEVLTKTYARTSMKNFSTPFSFFFTIPKKKKNKLF